MSRNAMLHDSRDSSTCSPFAIVVAVNFGINERLMVAGDPAQTARNILAHERLFRIGIASNLVYEAGLLVLLSALYVTLGPAGRTSALLGAFWRLVYASMWVLMSLNQLIALRLLKGADYLRVLGTDGITAPMGSAASQSQSLTAAVTGARCDCRASGASRG